MPKLTPDEIKKYAPYHTMEAFEQGYAQARVHLSRCPHDRKSVDAQAWDRGAELAMRHRLAEMRRA
jgi:hypothetical protein